MHKLLLDLGDFYESNHKMFWVTVVASILAFTLFDVVVGGTVGAVRAVIADPSPCVTDGGLVRSNAPSNCYADGRAHIVAPLAEPTSASSGAERMLESSKKPEPLVYDPPKVEKSYKKSYISGVIETVTFGQDANGETSVNSIEDHFQPDTTVVTYSEPDATESQSTAFCGNVLEHFTPGKHMKMVLTDSNASDYNGCYALDGAVTGYTFGGKGLPKNALPQFKPSKVPSAAKPEPCPPGDGGTCG